MLGSRKKVRILFLSANSGAVLRIDEEYRAIKDSLRSGRYRNRFQLIAELAVRRDDVQRALLDHQPHIVHFSGHGNAKGELMLLEEGPRSAPLSAAALASLFRALRDNLEIVVLNACFTSAQAAAIREVVGIVVGMRSPIDDRAAVEFARSFYLALAYGRSVREAFDLGVAGVTAINEAQQRVPEFFEDRVELHREAPQPALELFTHAAIDASAVRLVEPPPVRRLAWVAAAVLVGSFGLAWLAWRRGRPDRGMVRFAAAMVLPGAFNASARPAICAAMSAAEECAELARPDRVAPVRVSAFELDVREVSNTELAAWLNATSNLWVLDADGVIQTRQLPAVPLVTASDACFGALTVSPDGRVIASPDKARWPAVCVTWYGANLYCHAQGKRLPLATEWEYAAKGGGGRPFPWGRELPRKDGVAFYLRDGAAPHPRDVGTSPQDVTPEGVCDLGGNVAEWVDYGRGELDRKKIRGGSWSSPACHLLGSSCKSIPPEQFAKDVGFRCARSVIDESAASN